MSIQRLALALPALLVLTPATGLANPVAHASAAGIALPALGTAGLAEVLVVGAALLAAAMVTRYFSRS